MSKLLKALLRAAGVALPFAELDVGGGASAEDPRADAVWTRERALAVLLPIAEGEAPDSARVAAVAELNRMFGLHGPTLGQLVEAAQAERKPWDGAI